MNRKQRQGLEQRSFRSQADLHATHWASAPLVDEQVSREEQQEVNEAAEYEQ